MRLDTSATSLTKPRHFINMTLERVSKSSKSYIVDFLLYIYILGTSHLHYMTSNIILARVAFPLNTSSC